MDCKSEIEQYFLEDVESPSANFEVQFDKVSGPL